MNRLIRLVGPGETMKTDACFADSYAAAREAFLAACRHAGADVSSFENDAAGSEDGRLWTDVARFAVPGARRALVVISGTHGIEGFAGSACQVAVARDHLRPDAGHAATVYLVHALNPFGFAHRRRVNEDNVDVNRNFVDHRAPPVNPDYASVHPHLLPDDWDGPAREAADRRLFELVDAHGADWLQRAITAGQYTHPDGLFYGGAAPVWSNRLLRSFVADELTGYSTVAVIDLHTGLGEHGCAEVIFRGPPGSREEQLATRWYGAVTSSERGDASSTVIGGNTPTAFEEGLRHATLVPVTLEFGTRPPLEVLGALRAEQWLACHPKAATPTLEVAVAAGMQEAFACPDETWRASVLREGERLVLAALRGLESIH